MSKTGSAPHPTLEDVAQVAQVSTATISRCINNPDKVAPATRERIQQAIAALGYISHAGGRALASRRSNTVGAVIPTMANAMFASGLQAFQEALAAEGVTLLVASSGYDPHEELRQIRSLVTHGADALLLIGDDRLPETRAFLARRKIPYVLAWCYKSGTEELYAGFDNRKAARQLTQEVLADGHRRIAMIAGISKGNDRAAERIIGVREAIEASDTDARLQEVVECRYSSSEGARALSILLAATERPTAIICGNDVLAAGALTRARECGLTVPDDLSITGFDDIDIATCVYPALTTVHVPHRRMGRAAASLLLDHLVGEASARSVEIETEVIRRQSLGSPRATAISA